MTGARKPKNRMCTLSLDIIQWRCVNRGCKLKCSVDSKPVRVWLLKAPAKVGQKLVKICPIGICESELSVLMRDNVLSSVISIYSECSK